MSTDRIFILVALVIYFAAMIGIGFYAYKKTEDHEDYMLAGRNLPPWVAALSAGASDMSGWLMMGLPGAIYVSGLIEAWIAIGLTIGAYLNWKFVAPRLRAYTEISRNSITIPSFFENRLRDKTRLLRVLSGFVILVFFTFYISSMMVAGGVFFESAFGGDYILGMILVAGVTLVYTLFGGFLGASLTDVIQGLMMLLALLILPAMALVAMGGFGETANVIESVGPGHLSLFGDTALTTAGIVAIISALAWGLGYFGQPHIIVRFMALRSPQEAKVARRVGIGWMALSLAGAVAAGLIGLAYFTSEGIALDDPETVVLEMAQIMFHPLIAGLVLAAVLAAIMSTVSSQLIVSSSALVEDLYKVFKKKPAEPKRLVVYGRIGVLGVAIAAGLLSISPNDTILGLVGFAWAGFGAAFGPIIMLSLFWRKLTNWGAIAGMFAGAAMVFIWDALDFALYEIVPAFFLNLVVAVIVSLLTYKRNDEIDQEFTDTDTMTVVRPKTQK